jgi:hypothetical protein
LRERVSDRACAGNVINSIRAMVICWRARNLAGPGDGLARDGHDRREMRGDDAGGREGGVMIERFSPHACKTASSWAEAIG